LLSNKKKNNFDSLSGAMIQCFSLTTKQHEPAFKSEKSSAEQG